MSTSTSNLAHSMAMMIMTLLFGGLTFLLMVAAVVSYFYDSPMTKWLVAIGIVNLVSTSVFAYRFYKS